MSSHQLICGAAHSLCAVQSPESRGVRGRVSTCQLQVQYSLKSVCRTPPLHFQQYAPYVHCPARFVSLWELTRQQHTPCCSSLSWSSAHYREQARRAEQALPAYRALPRDNILLIGYLYDGPAEGASEGGWWVRDAGGAVPCQVSERRAAS